MTSNKHFNTYKEGLDLEFLLEYCMEHLDDESFDAYERIGTLYREGLDGITRDYQEAIYWYKKGIDAGKPSSSAVLAKDSYISVHS